MNCGRSFPCDFTLKQQQTAKNNKIDKLYSRIASLLICNDQTGISHLDIDAGRRNKHLEFEDRFEARIVETGEEVFRFVRRQPRHV